MESVSKYKLIIEFNGLPGTGKTTIANYVESTLKEQGLKVYREFYYNEKHKNIKSIFVSVKWSFLAFRLFLLTILIKPRKNRKNGIIAFVKYIRMYHDYLRSKDNSVLITDEGILQAITSIYYLDPIINKQIVERLINNVSIKIVRVDCLSNVELSAQRIEQRGITGARLDRLESNTRTSALSIQASNFEIIRTLANEILDMDCIVVDTIESPVKNACLVCEKITDLIKNEI